MSVEISKDMRPFIIDEGVAQFMLKVDQDTDYSMSFDVYEVVAWEMGGIPADVEDYMHGCIKWDGCSHVHFGEPDGNGVRDGYLHLCGKSEWVKHTRMMTELYELAEKTIKHYDAEVAE